MPTLASIHVYPVKSLGGFSVHKVRLTDRGLEHDRRWMLIDGEGRFLTQRAVPAMACLHCAPDGTSFTVTDVRNGSRVEVPWSMAEGVPVQAQVWQDAVELLLGPDELHQWFSEALQRPVRLAYMPERTVRKTEPHYADARVALSDAFPVLIISQASLDELNARLAVPVPMDRFRPNLVVAGGEAFQEDDWKAIMVGAVRFRTVKPCARCVIPTTDQRTGRRSPEPMRTLATYRTRDNNVLFGMNATFDGPGVLHAGDPVRPA